MASAREQRPAQCCAACTASHFTDPSAPHSYFASTNIHIFLRTVMFYTAAALQDVSRWLSPADLRRARLVCKSWLAALATLSTKATTPPEANSVTKWREQLQTMVLALPCLQELTISSKLSSVGAQQLGVLAGARQLRCIHIPYGQALQDRSLQVREACHCSMVVRK